MMNGRKTRQKDGEEEENGREINREEEGKT